MLDVGSLARRALPAALASLAALAAAPGCGDDAGGDDDAPDAGLPPSLAIVSPGDSVGLAPGDTAELRVRYTTGEGAPIVGAPVAFALVAGADGAGGSTLSAASLPTDGSGEAAVTFLAGASGFDLRVVADAAGARATFYVSVSAGGFASLDVTPRYDGARGDDELARVELRLYRGATHACADLDVDAPPDSPLAPRTLPRWDEVATWPSVNADEPYALLVWGVHAVSGAPVSAACVDVPASALPSGPAALELTVPDRALALAPQPLATVLGLAPLDAALDARGAHRPWRSLACPLGRGQLVLDWVVDALSGDGALDGVTAQPTGLGATLAALRGAPAGDGCRPATLGGGGETLDAALDAGLDGGGVPGGAALETLLARRDALLGALRLDSELAPVDAPAIAHRLARAHLDAPGAPEVDLADTDRAVVDAVATTGPPRPGLVAIASHGYTLRAGSLLQGAFDVTALAPVGLDGLAGELGTTLVAGAEDGAAQGCAAVSQVVCEAAGQPASCATAACGAAAFALDGALAAWWRQADGTGLDLVWSGAAQLADADGDLIADPIAAGTWAATLVLVDGAEVAVDGQFAAPVP